MADITYLPHLHVGQVEKRDSSDTTKANIPRLASAVDNTATTFQFTYAVGLDEDGTVTTLPTIVSIKNEAGYTEHIYAQTGEWSSDGKTLTLTSADQRGLELSGDNGVNITTGIAANRAKHEAGSEVRIGVSPLYWDAMVKAMQGSIASGGASWKIGREIAEDIKVYFIDDQANPSWFGKDSATNQLVYSNDGVSSTPFGTGAGVTGGDGITVTAGDIDIDTTDTTVFVETTAGAADAGKVAKLDAAGLIKQANVEGWKDVTATATEINQALDGISANVTDTNLNTLTAGTASNASALHSHDTVFQSAAVSAPATVTQTAAGSYTLDLATGLTAISQFELNIYALANDSSDANVFNTVIAKVKGVSASEYTVYGISSTTGSSSEITVQATYPVYEEALAVVYGLASNTRILSTSITDVTVTNAGGPSITIDSLSITGGTVTIAYTGAGTFDTNDDIRLRAEVFAFGR